MRSGRRSAAELELRFRPRRRDRRRCWARQRRVHRDRIRACHRDFTGFGEVGRQRRSRRRTARWTKRAGIWWSVPVGVLPGRSAAAAPGVGQGGSFRTLSLSRHARTNADVVRLFRDVEIAVTARRRGDVARGHRRRRQREQESAGHEVEERPTTLRQERRDLRRPRGEHARPARRRRKPRRARGADGRRAPGLRDADRRGRRVHRKVSVVGVGFDIACGNAAIRTDLSLRDTPGLPFRCRRSPTRSRISSRSASAGRTRRTTRRSTTRCSRRRVGGAAGTPGGAAREGARSAGHRRQRQPLRRRVRGRAGTRSGWACTSAAAGSATPSRPASCRSRRAQSGGSASPSARCCWTSTRRSATTTGR